MRAKLTTAPIFWVTQDELTIWVELSDCACVGVVGVPLNAGLVCSTNAPVPVIVPHDVAPPAPLMSGCPAKPAVFGSTNDQVPAAACPLMVMTSSSTSEAHVS